MKKRYYAAYGSNLNTEQMANRCPDAKIAGTSNIKNYGLLFKGSKTGCYLTIEPSVKNHVPVGIWEVSEKDEKNLDRYEGFPNFYYKKEMILPVTDETGRTKRRKVFVYIMHESRPIGLPSRTYWLGCLQGYKEFGFDSKILSEALDRSSRHENEYRKENLPQMRQRIRRIPRSFQKG